MSHFSQEYKDARKAEHHAKYGAMVTDSIIRVVSDSIGVDKIKNSTDEHFNDIPLKQWDALRPYMRGAKTLSDAVCIAKAAARAIKNGNV